MNRNTVPDNSRILNMRVSCGFPWRGATVRLRCRPSFVFIDATLMAVVYCYT